MRPDSQAATHHQINSCNSIHLLQCTLSYVPAVTLKWLIGTQSGINIWSAPRLLSCCFCYVSPSPPLPLSRCSSANLRKAFCHPWTQGVDYSARSTEVVLLAAFSLWRLQSFCFCYNFRNCKKQKV